MGALADVPVAVLCGGQGTRLRPALSDRQKTMADVGGRPFLERLVEWASGQGPKDFVFCTGYRAEDVEGHFRGRRGISATFSRETSPLGTAGALRQALHALGGRMTLVLNGDSHCAVDLRGLLEHHRARSSPATLVAARAAGRTDGGGVRWDAEGRVVAFTERAVDAGGWINAGVYLLEPSFLDRLPDRVPCSLEREVFPDWAGRGLSAFSTDEPVHDIGTPERWAEFRGKCAA